MTNLNDLFFPPPVAPEITKRPDPKWWFVYGLNDEDTPMEFAHQVYRAIFHVDHLSKDELFKVLHETNRVRLGMYTLEVAETKIIQAVLRSHRAGYQMQFDLEPVDLEAI